MINQFKSNILKPTGSDKLHTGSIVTTHLHSRKYPISTLSVYLSWLFSAVIVTLVNGLILSTAIAQAPVPRNRALADSTWPIYHANNYATAAVMDSDTANPTGFETVENLTHRRFGHGTVSPWTVLRTPEVNGDQVVLTTPNSGVAKYILKDGHLHGIDYLKLERDWTDFDWTIAVLADGTALVTERKHNRFAIIGDSQADPYSPLRVLRRIPVNSEKYGPITSHFTVTYDVTIITATKTKMLLAIDIGTGQVVDSLRLNDAASFFHNSFPIDETGRMYLSTQKSMIAVDWNGTRLTSVWESAYNMRGPGFEDPDNKRTPFKDAIDVARGMPGTGSGTTPTLLGNARDGVVVIVDGHSPKNNLVAFWRGKIPVDWKALPDPAYPGKRLDRRVAGVFALPLSTPDGEGHTAENSPAVIGNAIVVAQWAGFSPDETPPKGVQRVDWNPALRQFDLVWTNPDVHLNGVPSIAMSSKGAMVFGMGRNGRRYVYSGLCLETGRQEFRIDLGPDESVLDQGNNHVITADGAIIYGGKKAMVHLFNSP